MIALLELFVIIAVCSILISIIMVNYILDTNEYMNKLQQKKYFIYLFKDGTNLLSRSLDDVQLQEEIDFHGELIKIIEEK